MADDVSWYAAHLAGRDLIIGGLVSAAFSVFLLLFCHRIGFAAARFLFLPAAIFALALLGAVFHRVWRIEWVDLQ